MAVSNTSPRKHIPSSLFLAETPLPEAPKHFFRPLFPRNPISPPSGPTQWLFQKPPAESKFLAAKNQSPRDW